MDAYKEKWREFRKWNRLGMALILAFLLAGICLTGLLVLFWGQLRPVTDISIWPRGIQTNSTGTSCMLVAVTNRSSRTYIIWFATLTKAEGGWADPSLIKHFDACGSEQLQPGSGVEVLVPVPQTRVPWRVAAAYSDVQIPRGLGRIWRSLMFRLNQRHYLKFLTTPEISSNEGARPNDEEGDPTGVPGRASLARSTLSVIVRRIPL